MVRIGELKHRIYLQFPLIETDDIGGATEVWPELETEADYNIKTYAKVKPAASDRMSQASHTYIEDTFDFTIRRREGLNLTKTWRVVYNENPYVINGITEINEAKRFIVIRAKLLK